MTEITGRLTAEETNCLRTAQELEEHLVSLDTLTPTALGVFAIASGIYKRLVAKTKRSIELLKEKRSALITAAVTGKIDVRSTA